MVYLNRCWLLVGLVYFVGASVCIAFVDMFGVCLVDWFLVNSCVFRCLIVTCGCFYCFELLGWFVIGGFAFC